MNISGTKKIIRIIAHAAIPIVVTVFVLMNVIGIVGFAMMWYAEAAG